jgi:cell wall assembly regulator SMI1
MSFKKLREELHRHARTIFDQGASDTDIKDAERTLGVVLSLSYRHFLRDFGWGSVAHFEIFGLGSEVPHYLDLINMTQRERTEMEPAIPKYLVPLMNDGAGNHYCLDTSQMKKDECPVVFWDHELGRNQRPALVAPSFDLWLLELLNSIDAKNT